MQRVLRISRSVKLRLQTTTQNPRNTTRQAPIAHSLFKTTLSVLCYRAWSNNYTLRKC